MAHVLRFRFKKGVAKKLIESQIAIAILTAEATFGSAKVRLHAGYVVSNDKAVIDVSSDVGEHIAQVFTGLMTHQIGESNFTVMRLKTTD